MHLPYLKRASGSPKSVVTDTICHVTHDGPAEEIDEGEFYVFKPFKKNGKPPGNKRSTYIICDAAESKAPNEDTKYRKVSEHESLLPGCYTWWSPAENQPGEMSPFGNRTFTAKLTDLFKCYQESCGLSDLSEVQLRIGGTLRYDRRACKLIIVCSSKCEELNEDEYPLFDDSLPLQDIADDIKLKLDYEEPYTVRVARKIRRLQHFDKYAFVFYFPNDSCELKCPKNIIKPGNVSHNPLKCISKERFQTACSAKISCPNSISESLRKARKRKTDDTLVDDSQSKRPALEEQDNNDNHDENNADCPKEPNDDVVDLPQEEDTLTSIDEPQQKVTESTLSEETLEFNEAMDPLVPIQDKHNESQ